MDLTKITDTTQLKALAYEQVVVIEQSQTNLRLIQQRLRQLEEQPADTPTKTGKASAAA